MLSRARIDEIEQLAVETLTPLTSKTEPFEYPVKIGELAKKLDYTVEVVSFTDTNISGAFSRTLKKIQVSSIDSPRRQAFSIAHELGHAILHGEGDVLYRSAMNALSVEDRSREQEANWFASALLMPKIAIGVMWTYEKNVNVIADYFGVSPTAARYRLINAGLLRP